MVGGLPRGRMVRFAAQVACVPTTIFVFYATHTMQLPANGTSWWGCILLGRYHPGGGGTAVANPLSSTVAEGGFSYQHAGKFDGYQAQVCRLPRRAQMPFAVQVVCLSAPGPPTYGPSVGSRAAVARADERIGGTGGAVGMSDIYLAWGRTAGLFHWCVPAAAMVRELFLVAGLSGLAGIWGRGGLVCRVARCVSPKLL